MDILEKVKEDLVEAMKAKEELKISTLRMFLSAIKNYEIEKGGAGYSASEEDVITILNRQVKQRKDSITAFKEGNRPELAEKEEKELSILQDYLPAQLTNAEIEALVVKAISETGASKAVDIGKVMGKISSDLKGKADMTFVSKLVREKLSS